MGWLNERRLRVYPRIAVVLAAFWWSVWMLAGDGLADPRGEAVGGDFVTFYAASELALDGDAAEAYTPEVMREAEQIVVPGDRGTPTWGYPPSFYVTILPLSLLPFLASFAAWAALATVAYLSVARAIAPVRNITWLAAASGGFMQCIIQGQTGIWIAVALGGGLLLLPRNRYIGGATLGIIAFKPQMAALVPVAVLASREWRAILPGVGVAGGFALASLAVLGSDTWRAFWDEAGNQVGYFEDGLWDYRKMPTVGASALIMGLPVAVARTLQLVSALATACVVAWLWAGSAPHRVKSAGLAFGVLLATPYAYDYDMAVVGVGLAFLGMEAHETGWLPWEKEGLFMGYVLPYLFGPVAWVTSIQLAPIGIAALLVLAVRRARTFQREPADIPPCGRPPGRRLDPATGRSGRAA